MGAPPAGMLGGEAVGVRDVAMATGWGSREKRAEQQPDFLFGELSNVEHVIATLGW